MIKYHELTSMNTYWWMAEKWTYRYDKALLQVWSRSPRFESYPEANSEQIHRLIKVIFNSEILKWEKIKHD